MIKLVKNQGAVDLSKKMMKGDDGGYYIPTVDNEGNLSWSGSEAEMPAIEGANIQGPQGDPGYNTVWIGTEAPEDPNMTVWVDIDGKPTEGLATKGYVDEAIANVPGADLSNYYTKEEVNEAIDGISDCGFDSKDYYTKTEVDSMIPITTGLATEQYVDDAIAAIDIPDNTPVATVDVAGKVKPDGITITITEDGTISSVATGGGSVEVDGTTIVNKDGVLSLAKPITGNDGIAIGPGAEASGNGAFVAGGYAKANGYSAIALGNNAYSYASNSVAIGDQVQTYSGSQVAIGFLNEADRNNKYILIVGNGEPASAANGYSGVRKNALTITKADSKVWAAGGFYVGEVGSEKELATKEYVDEEILKAAAGDIDLGDYATKTYVDEKGYQTETQVNALINTAISAIVDGDEVSY